MEKKIIIKDSDVVDENGNKFIEYDSAEYLDNDELIAGALDLSLQSDDPKMLAMTLNDIARAKGITKIAKLTGLKRDNIYKSLSKSGNPSYATIKKILDALDIKLHATKHYKEKEIVI
jgi:probable addiction module antidote protein